MNFSRARLRARAVVTAASPLVDEVLAERIQRLIGVHPTFGYRRLWALLRFGQSIRINRKAVYRVLKLKGWLVNQRVARPRPRVHGLRSRAHHSNERWAMDVTHVPCGADGWGIVARVNSEPYKPNSWVDARGTLDLIKGTKLKTGYLEAL